ncbi:MAG: hypothetical protein QM426_10535 [Euryarchaeota archaeon]|nr:hypothetical protein [Euryarchaeota archaeon]
MKKIIEIRERDIPNIEIKVLSGNYKPIGKYNLKNFLKKYGGW